MAASSEEIILQEGIVVKNAKSWIVCLCAGLFFMYEFIQMNIFNAINIDLRHSFDLTATQLGYLSSSYLLADILFLLPAGIMLDRWSTRKIILSAMVICILGTFGFASTNSLYLAAFYHALTGVGNAFCFLACIILVARWFLPNQRAFVVGLIGTLAFTGGLMAQTPLVWMTSNLGWRQSLIYDGIIGVVILVAIYLTVEDSPPKQNNLTLTSFAPSNFGQSLFMAIKNPQNWLAALYTCFLNLPIMVLDAVWGVSYLHKVHHLSTIQASNVTGMIFMGSIVGCPLVGWLSDKFGLRRKPMLWGGILSLIFMSIVIVTHDLSYQMLLLVFFGVGFFTSTQVITYPLITESNPLNITGTATGFASLLILGGACIAQVLFGKLLDLNWDGLISNGQRIYTSADYNMAMLMFPLALLLGLVMVWFVRETFCLAYKEQNENS